MSAIPATTSRPEEFEVSRRKLVVRLELGFPASVLESFAPVRRDLNLLREWAGFSACHRGIPGVQSGRP